MKNLPCDQLTVSYPWYSKICFMTFSDLHTHTPYNKLNVSLCLINFTNLAITANYSGSSHERTLLGREMYINYLWERNDVTFPKLSVNLKRK